VDDDPLLGDAGRTPLKRLPVSQDVDALLDEFHTPMQFPQTPLRLCGVIDAIPPQSVLQKPIHDTSQPDLDMASLKLIDQFDSHMDFFQWLRLIQVPVVSFIPKKCRKAWHAALLQCIRLVVRNPLDLELHAKLQLLPKAVLQKSVSSKRRTAKSQQARQILDKLKLWNSGEKGQLDLFQQLVSYTPSNSPFEVSDASQSSKRLKRVKFLVGVKRLSSAAQTLVSCGLAPISAETVETLQKLFPERKLPPPSSTTTQALVADEHAVLDALKSFPVATGSGRDGLKAQHLKDALLVNSSNSRDSLTNAFVDYINLLLSGSLPLELSPFISSAPLVPLLKKDGGIRPIAIGEIWRRWASKVAARHGATAMKAKLRPLQVGVSTPNGAEAIVHSMNHLIATQLDTPGITCFKVDYKNAFNTIRRLQFCEAVQKDIPELQAYVDWIYGDEANMYIGDDIIPCTAGVQQGDPLGPLLFAMGLHPIVETIQRECPSLLMNAWYLDDGTIVGKTEDVYKAFTILREMSPEYGLELNLKKCELWWTRSDLNWSLFPAEIHRNFDSGTELLGSAVGSSDFKNRVLLKRVQKIKQLHSALKDIDSAQTKMHLLRSCIGMPKFAFSLRTLNYSEVSNAIDQFDELMLESLIDILGVEFSDLKRLHMSLPLGDGFGGFGVPLAKYVSDAAYLASCQNSRALQVEILNSNVDLPALALKSLERINADLDVDHQMPGQTFQSLSPIYNLQHKIGNVLNRKISQQLLNACKLNNREMCRLKAVSLAHSTDFLHLAPTRFLGQELSNQEFQNLCRYHLGIPIRLPKACVLCKAANDDFGDHSTICSKGTSLTRRHNRIRDYLANEFKKAGFAVEVEPNDLCMYNDRRPGDVRVFCYKDNKDLLIDVTVTSSFNNMSLARNHAGYNLKKRADEKMRKYEKDLDNMDNVDFMPFVIESLGGRSTHADKVLEKIALCQAHISGSSYNDCLNAVRTGFSAVFSHAMADMWSARMDPELAKDAMFW